MTSVTRKGQTRDIIRVGPISQTAGDAWRLRSKGHPVINGLWGIERSHDWWCHVIPKGQVVTPIWIESKISKTDENDI